MNFRGYPEWVNVYNAGGLVRGLYFGLERTGEHGLWYTLVQIVDIALSRDERIAFTVPARDLFRERPTGLEDTEKQKAAKMGFTRTELVFRGQLKKGKLVLRCISQPTDCPEDVMVFHKEGGPNTKVSPSPAPESSICKHYKGISLRILPHPESP